MKRYIRFLNLKNALMKGQVDQELDLTSQKLLELVAMAEHCDQKMTVTQAMRLNLASPATIHRKIDDLLHQGYITFEFVGQNRRTKYIALTKKTTKHFDELGKLLVKTAAQTP
jgi:DNA-binding MarR family transcriptional regulator